MRKRTAGVLTSLVLVLTCAPDAAAQTTAQAALQAVPQGAADSLTVDEIVAKHLETKGGADQWKSIQTQKMTGIAIAQGFELAMTVYAKRPNVSRQELTLQMSGQPAVTIVNLFDGTKAWTINPMSGSSVPQEMPAAQTATAMAQSDFDGALIDSQAKGYSVTLLDPVTISNKKAIHLRVAKEDVPTQHFYLDPVTFVELRIATEGVSASETDLSDYKDIDGVMVPHSIRISQGGTLQAELKILTVEFNTPLDDALFRVK